VVEVVGRAVGGTVGREIGRELDKLYYSSVMLLSGEVRL
jgi:hypothetical protein